MTLDYFFNMDLESGKLQNDIHCLFDHILRNLKNEQQDLTVSPICMSEVAINN